MNLEQELLSQSLRRHFVPEVALVLRVPQPLEPLDLALLRRDLCLKLLVASTQMFALRLKPTATRLQLRDQLEQVRLPRRHS